MPGSEEFLKLFGIEKNMVIAGYRLVKATSSHEQIVLWREYRYDITLKFEWIHEEPPSENQITKLHRELSNHVSGIRLWTSPANRIWKCIFSRTGSLPQFTGNGVEETLRCIGSGKLTSKKKVESGEALNMDFW